VRVEVRYLEQSVWAQVSERKGREGLIFGGWSGMDADLVWYPLLYTGQYQSYYSNRQLDALLDRGRATIDQAERLAIYRQAAAIIYDDCPLLPMFQPPQIYAMNAALNWRPRTDTMIDLRSAEFA
jgi:peptide/nickel transport system substrate-binding protein